MATPLSSRRLAALATGLTLSLAACSADDPHPDDAFRAVEIEVAPSDGDSASGSIAEVPEDEAFGGFFDGNGMGGWETQPPSEPVVARQPVRPAARGLGIEGVRMFWIQTSVLSNSGASGFVHFCPGGVLYTSSEGSFAVEGGGGWAGGAHALAGGGRWSILYENGNPYVHIEYAGGTTEWYWVADLLSGDAWRSGQYKFAAERGRATCP